ncbi:MAG: histidine phosphatase family protein [Gemmatimonadaceae bacterium]
MPLNLYFLRHGQTDSSRDNVFCGSGLNPDLTPDGRAMADAFAAAYRDKRWQTIFSSPLKRAMETAAPIAATSGVKVEIRDELREIGYGAWEGKTVEEVDREYHDDYTRWLADPGWNAPTGGGETANAVASRVMQFTQDITRRFSDGDVLVVSHKATIRIALCALIGIDVGRFRYRLGCPVASVSVVEFGKHGPLLHRLADRAHLDARLRDLPGT